MNEIRVLIIEDNEFDFELLERKLKVINLPFITKRATNEAEFHFHLSNFNPDIILSDFTIPSFSGIKALELTKSYNAEIPFIFVSGSIGEEKAVETLKRGANDYVIKDNLNKLEPAIKRALEETQERKRRKIAEDKLKIRNNELSTLIYRISHDIRGPICNIKGVVNLSLKEDDIKEHLLYLELIEKETKKLEGIIKNLSNFQYIFSDGVRPSDIALEDFFEEIKASISQIEEFNDVQFNIEQSGEDTIKCDKNLLSCVLFNLIHNSIIFSDKSKLMKMVECSVFSSNEKISLVVKDNGIGMPREIIDKACDMFYRGSSASKGAGIGLYIVRTCLELLNAKMEIFSEAGVGTKIEISIPFTGL